MIKKRNEGVKVAQSHESSLRLTRNLRTTQRTSEDITAGSSTVDMNTRRNVKLRKRLEPPQVVVTGHSMAPPLVQASIESAQQEADHEQDPIDNKLIKIIGEGPLDNLNSKENHPEDAFNLHKVLYEAKIGGYSMHQNMASVSRQSAH